MVDEVSDVADIYWVCLPLALRNAVSGFQSQWQCWNPDLKDIWVRELPATAINDESFFPFFKRNMEFEDFIEEFSRWYADGQLTATLVGIRCDESLNRYRAIASKKPQRYKGQVYTTWKGGSCFNLYPIYDWKASDIWKYHSVYPDKPHNKVYDKMQMAGVPVKHQRLCQPYGDTQRRGLWLYSILEADTWSKLIGRVIGANSFAVYSQEYGNINGDGYITKPDHLTWEQYSKVMLKSLPRKTAEHYAARIRRFIGGWNKRGYSTIPDEVNRDVENIHFAPSWRRICRTLLRNDYWCKGLGMSQPKSEAYGKYLQIKKRKKRLQEVEDGET
jgi:predicted phosphoadenosine phosphosulfate sulfurtransferase